jgi:hypothetical protein
MKKSSRLSIVFLTDHPNTKITNATPRIFEGAGLKLECLVPYSKWRLTYIGMLKQDDENLFFVRLNFM